MVSTSGIHFPSGIWVGCDTLQPVNSAVLSEPFKLQTQQGGNFLPDVLKMAN
jgi:hypothetical protein